MTAATSAVADVEFLDADTGNFLQGGSAGPLETDIIVWRKGVASKALVALPYEALDKMKADHSCRARHQYSFQIPFLSVSILVFGGSTIPGPTSSIP